MTIANSQEPDQNLHNAGPGLVPDCLALGFYLLCQKKMEKKIVEIRAPDKMRKLNFDETILTSGQT